MNFIAWIISLPTAIVLFFFPAPVPEAPIHIQEPIQIVEVTTSDTITKGRVIDVLEKENIPVKEIPFFSFPAVGTPVETKPNTPMTEEPKIEPVVEESVAQVPTTIEIVDRKVRPLYSGCEFAPTAQFIVNVKDQNGAIVEGVEVLFETDAPNVPNGKFLSGNSDGRFNLTIKNTEKGIIKTTFKVGDISASINVEVIPAPTDSANRPDWCGVPTPSENQQA